MRLLCPGLVMLTEICCGEKHQMRCAMSLMVVLMGCEPMSEPGGFAAIAQPVAVESAVETAPPVVNDTTNDAMDFAEPVIIRSEDIQDQAEPAAPVTPDVQPAENDATPPEAEDAAAEPAAESAVEVEAQEEVVTTTTAGQGQPFTMGGWPLRLVKTLPDTNPPRAILGLPSGEEIVVSPGRMIPHHQLVVMAIGPQSAELAQITPNGDHANVHTISLQTQY